MMASGKNAKRARTPAPVVSKRQGLPWLTIGAVVVVLALAASIFVYVYSKQHAKSEAAAAVAAWVPSETNMDPSTKIPGIYVGASTVQNGVISYVKYKAALHVNSDQRVAYDRFPPVGGPHDAEWAACNGVVYATAVRDENMVHPMEHGAIWITYNPKTIKAGDLDILTRPGRWQDLHHAEPVPDPGQADFPAVLGAPAESRFGIGRADQTVHHGVAAERLHHAGEQRLLRPADFRHGKSAALRLEPTRRGRDPVERCRPVDRDQRDGFGDRCQRRQHKSVRRRGDLDRQGRGAGHQLVGFPVCSCNQQGEFTGSAGNHLVRLRSGEQSMTAPSGSPSPAAPQPPARSDSPVQVQWTRRTVAIAVALGSVVLLLIGGTLGLALAPATPTAGSSSTAQPGPADIGFAQDMIVHHTQGVAMANQAMLHTSDSDVRARAFDIASTQQTDIGELSGWLDLWGQPRINPGAPMSWMGSGGHGGMDMGSTGSTTDHSMAGMSMGTSIAGSGDSAGGADGAVMPGMATNAEMAKLRSLTGTASDIYFLQLMIRHHQGGLAMMQYAAAHAAVPAVRNFAGKMANAQEAEVSVMTQMLAQRGAQPLPYTPPTMPTG